MWWALALAWAEDVCLLTLKAQRGEAAVASAQWTERRESLSAWSQEHRKLRSAAPALGASESDFDFFILQQKQSSEACHAKMLETRRTLDGLHAKVYRLSEAIEANEAIVEAHTKTIEEKTKKKEVQEQGSEAKLAACEDEKKAELSADADSALRGRILGKVDAELEELRQIAAAANKKSAVQVSAVYQQVSGSNASGSFLQLNRSESLLNVSALSKAECQHAVAALSRRGGNATGTESKTYTQLDCEGSRAALQEEFTKSYRALLDLKKKELAIVDAQYEWCVDAATSAKDDVINLLDAQIGRSTDLINHALEMIKGVEPLLFDAKRSLVKVEAHMTDMKTQCAVEGSATEHLRRIRDLIESLERCPGRHDFKLLKP